MKSPRISNSKLVYLKLLNMPLLRMRLYWSVLWSFNWWHATHKAKCDETCISLLFASMLVTTVGIHIYRFTSINHFQNMSGVLHLKSFKCGHVHKKKPCNFHGLIKWIRAPTRTCKYHFGIIKACHQEGFECSHDLKRGWSSFVLLPGMLPTKPPTLHSTRWFL